MITRRAAVAAGLISPWAAGLNALAAEAAQPPSLDEFLRPARTRGASLSPDGRTIAVAHEVQEGGRKAFVSLVDTANFAAKPARILIGDYDVESVTWANAKRLLITVLMTQLTSRASVGSLLETSYDLSVRRVLSIGLDGSPEVMLFNHHAFQRSNYDLSYVVDLLHDDPDHVLVHAWEPMGSTAGLYRVNVLTGTHEFVERGTSNTAAWWAQDGKAMLRWDFNSRGTVATLYGRSPGEATWRQLRRITRSDGISRPDFDIVGATEQAGVLLAVHRAPGEASATLRPFDIRTSAFGAPLYSHPTRDVAGALTDRRGRYLAAIYQEDRVVYDFADKQLGPHFRGLESYFGKACNVRPFSFSDDGMRFIAFVSGPQLPGSYVYYDLAARRVELFATRQPWLTRDRLAPVVPLSVTTRDGASIGSYLTKPAGSGLRPLVVMPHGGPALRDTFGYDLWAQVLASRGWLVLQPNFRGSGGFGRAFEEAGHRRWGARMQEDVEDAVDQVLASGQADPKRVAIFGASYGGYAALMGAVRRPDFYRAVVSIAGVSDLPAFLADVRREGADDPYYQLWLQRIGDPNSEAARLVAESPQRRAAEIKAPVLLLHGQLDRVVAVDQSRSMHAALKASGKSSELTIFKDAGHSGWNGTVHNAVLSQSVSFIEKAFA